jgi:pentapeptide MXKDX repeat protein
MKKLLQMAATVVIGFSLALAIAGCGSSSPSGKDKMGGDKMAGDKMAGDKMGGDKMSGDTKDKK